MPAAPGRSFKHDISLEAGHHAQCFGIEDDRVIFL